MFDDIDRRLDGETFALGIETDVEFENIENRDDNNANRMKSAWFELENQESSSQENINTEKLFIQANENLERLYYTMYDDLSHLASNLDISDENDFEVKSCLNSIIDENGVVTTQKLFNKIYLLHTDDIKLMRLILYFFTKIRYDLIDDSGVSTISLALNHQDIIVKDYAIQNISLWDDNKYVKLLENTEVHEPWLNDYLKCVIEELLEE